MRIDAHVHGDFSKLQGSPQDYVKKCRDRGVERVLLIQDPEPTMEAYRALPDFIIPVPWIDIDKITVKEINEILDGGAAGIKFIDPQFSYGDTRYDPLYAAISDQGQSRHVPHRLPGDRRLRARPPTPTSPSCAPAAIDCMSRRHPDLKILMAHFGNPWWEEAWKITWSVPNVYAELSGGTAYQRSLMMWARDVRPQRQPRRVQPEQSSSSPATSVSSDRQRGLPALLQVLRRPLRRRRRLPGDPRESQPRQRHQTLRAEVAAAAPRPAATNDEAGSAHRALRLFSLQIPQLSLICSADFASFSFTESTLCFIVSALSRRSSTRIVVSTRG